MNEARIGIADPSMSKPKMKLNYCGHGLHVLKSLA